MKILKSIYLLLSFILLMSNNLSLQANTATPKIQITQITIEGMINKQDKTSLNKLLSLYKNTSLTLKQIQELKNKLNNYYKQKGKLFTKVLLPPQTLINGVLKFRVIRGKVGKISIKGNKYYSTNFIKRNFDLKSGEFLNYNALMKSLLLLNKYNDLQIKSYLKKGSTFGETDINLQVKDKKPFHGNLTVDNLGSDSTSKYRVTLGLFYGNLFKDGDEVNLDTTIGLNSINTKLYRINYKTTPFGKYHTRLDFGYLYANYITSGSFAVLELKGDTNIYSIGINQPFIYTPTNQVSFSLNYTNKYTKSYLLGALSSKDTLNIATLSTSWQHLRVYDSLNLAFAISKGFGGDGSFGSRLNENTDFSRYNINLSYNRYINEKNNILFTLNSQYSSSRLPLSEMFTLGGLNSVRGFNSAVKLGDYGYTTSLEWLYHHSINYKWLKNALQFGVFIDNGIAYANNPVPGEEKSLNLTGAGVELIANIKKKYSARIGVGFPINYSNKSIDKSAKFYLLVNAKLW